MATRNGQIISKFELYLEIKALLSKSKITKVISIMLELFHNGIIANVQEVCDCLAKVKHQDPNKIMRAGAI